MVRKLRTRVIVVLGGATVLSLLLQSAAKAGWMW
jgi:hypothetical protein